MPGAKGKRTNLKTKEPVEDMVNLNDDKGNDEVSDGDAPAVKGRAVAKKGKTIDSQKGGTIEVEDLESKNGKKDNDEEAVDKSAPKSRGRPGVKKTAAGLAKESESNGEEDVEPPKKVSKKGVANKKETNDASEEKEEESVKPKKGGKKEKALPKSEDGDEMEEVSRPKVSQKRGAQAKNEEVVPSRRGGDRAVKKPKEIVDEPEEKVPAKKGRSAKAKNGADQESKNGDKSMPGKEDAKKRGRQAKKGKADTESDAGSETSDIAEKPHTIAIEHCKS